MTGTIGYTCALYVAVGLDPSGRVEVWDRDTLIETGRSRYQNLIIIDFIVYYMLALITFFV